MLIGNFFSNVNSFKYVNPIAAEVKFLITSYGSWKRGSFSPTITFCNYELGFLMGLKRKEACNCLNVPEV